MKFYASVRMDVRKGDAIKSGSENVGHRVKVKIVKNKLAPPFKTAEFDILFGRGISREGSLIDVGTEKGVIQKAGAYYSFGDIRLGQGRDNARAYLEQNPDLADEIDDQIREKLLADRAPAEEEASTDEDRV